MLSNEENAKLAIELTQLKYSGKEDIVIAGLLNQPGTTTSSQKIPMRTLMKFLISSGIHGKLKAKKSTDSVADAALDVLTSPHFTEIDTLDAATTKLLTALESSGIISNIEHLSIASMSKVTLTRAEEVLGRSPVSIHHLDVAKALRG